MVCLLLKLGCGDFSSDRIKDGGDVIAENHDRTHNHQCNQADQNGILGGVLALFVLGHGQVGRHPGFHVGQHGQSPFWIEKTDCDMANANVGVVRGWLPFSMDPSLSKRCAVPKSTERRTGPRTRTRRLQTPAMVTTTNWIGHCQLADGQGCWRATMTSCAVAPGARRA